MNRSRRETDRNADHNTDATLIATQITTPIAKTIATQIAVPIALQRLTAAARDASIINIITLYCGRRQAAREAKLKDTYIGKSKFTYSSLFARRTRLAAWRGA